ncbi:MAG: tetraacyldisaccharide 4'-kinase [Alphaproteobacteria bacterium]
MPLKTPSFWYPPLDQTPAYWEKALWPASVLYQSVHRVNQALNKNYHAPFPVICVGNATAGGSGKTPLCIALAKLVNKPDLYFLTKGYKGSLESSLIVDPRTHLNDMVGDEALLLARYATTIKSANRIEGMKLAEAQNAALVIMDDGLQNPSVHKDISFMVIDGAHGFGNGKTLPAGPLREPLEKAFSRADAFILIGEDERNIKSLLPEDKPIFRADIIPQELDGPKKVVAFCGLGLPEKFKTTLANAGYEIAGWHEFPDHHPYTHKELQNLKESADKLGASLITTEKDAMRIFEKSMLEHIQVLKISAVFENESAVQKFLQEHLP